MIKHYLGYGIAAVVLLVALYLWHKNEVSVAVSAEHAKAQDQVIQQAKDAILASEKARQQAISDLEVERKKPATIQTVTKLIPAPLPQGSQIKLETLPDSPTPQLVFTGDAQQNLDFIKGQLIDHRECDANLSACSQKAQQVQVQLTAMTAERDTWEQTAKGGSKWHRFFKAAKVIGCAGGGAALGSLWKVRGAAIGGAVGAGTCQVAF